MKTLMSLFAVAVALPVLAAPPVGGWESASGDFAPGGWTETLVGSSANAAGNVLELTGDRYALAGTVAGSEVVEIRFDSVVTRVTLSGGTLVLDNAPDAPWHQAADPNPAMTIDLVALEKVEKAFTDPMGNPMGLIDFTIRGEGVAADDPTVGLVVEARYVGMPGLDMTGEPFVRFGDLAGATLTVTRTVVPLTVDIKPGSVSNPVNLSSRGVVPVAILGTADVDVSRIDVATILLAGVAPVRASIGDVAVEETEDGLEVGDGIPDLVLKFKTQHLAAALGNRLRNSRVALTLTARLLDGTPVSGSDSIRILTKNRPVPNSQRPAKSN